MRIMLSSLFAPRAIISHALHSNLARTSTPASSHSIPRAFISSRPVRLPSNRRLYHAKVLDHYERPRNVGSMPKAYVGVGTGLVGAPACGDVMKLQLRVDSSNKTITDVKFKTFGCGSAIAASSFATELIKGMDLETAGKVRNMEIAQELSLPPVKCRFMCFYSAFPFECNKRWSGSNDL